MRDVGVGGAGLGLGLEYKSTKVMHLSIETLTPTPHPHPQDRVGSCLEGAPNARKPPPPSGIFFFGGGGALTKSHFGGALEAKSCETPTPMGQQMLQIAIHSPHLPTLSQGVGGQGFN